ncbi:MAG: peptide ABC transporter substrate-binding protein [Ardenticatenaceae bacterium]|nr:peptide ABC transporter substrate-binding protein [Ardenticatenaceae bacterium]
MITKFRWQLVLLILGLILLGIVYALGRQAEGISASGQTFDTPLLAADQANEAALAADGRCRDFIPGGVAIQGMVGRPQMINPLLADGNPVDEALTALLFDGLTTIDHQGRVIPALAAEWEVGEDGQTVLFTLKEGLTWHDGEPLTTADVAFTYQLLQDPTLNEQLPDGAIWRNLTVEPLDDRRIQITLAAPYSPFLQAAVRGILPAHLLEGVNGSNLEGHSFNERPVGSGPFQVANDWLAEGFLLLTPAAGQWPTLPILDGIQVRFYADDSALQNAFATGDIHFTAPISPVEVPAYLQIEQTGLYTGYQTTVTQLLFNVSEQGTAVTRDGAVRQGLAAAINRSGLLEGALNGQGVPLVGPFLANSWVNIPQPNVVDAEQQLLAAEEILTAGGWLPPSAENEVRASGETLLELTLLVPEETQLIDLGAELASQWQGLNGRFEIEVVPYDEYQSRLATRDYEAALINIALTSGPDLYDFWSQEAIVRGQNIAGWNNRRASEALEAARQVWSEEERRQFYQAFWQFYAADLPAVTIYQHMTNFAISDTIEGADAGPVYSERDRFATFANWTLPQNRAAESCLEE